MASSTSTCALGDPAFVVDSYYSIHLLSYINQLSATLLKKVHNEGNLSSCYSARKSFDKQLYHAEPPYSFAQPRQPSGKCQRFSNEIKENGIENAFEEESYDELFPGFLAIGTLGTESLNTKPPTPTFPMPCQNVTDKEIELTEDELKLINNELEKFLEAEAKEVADDLSARSSQASIITFSNKLLDDTDAEDWGYSATCPLQKYLFGSSIELPETAEGLKKEKTSLEELFKRHDSDWQNSTKVSDCTEKTPKKTYATRFMKKILKKLHSTARSCTTTASNEKSTESEATKRKLPKILKIFHRKVHPEGLLAEKQFIKAKKENIKQVSCKSSTPYGEDKGKKRSPKMATLQKEISQSVPSSERINSSSIPVNREHWIRTDADCKLGAGAVEQKSSEAMIISQLFNNQGIWFISVP
ncbi:hypothetical protein ACH5RR_010931 [Cinchona calisaya]|uniref:LAZY1 n=1 Tax=Cinchona calisaya TaxID=153742 RepID=A0ABD3A6W8_9GENT